MLTIANGLLGISIFYALMYWALVQVTAGTATIVLALVPLVTLLLASAQRLERLSARAVGGSLLAVVGITWMAIGPGRVTLSFIPLLALLGATVCAGESVIVAKMISANHPAVTNAISLATGAATLLAFSAMNGEQWALPAQSEVAWALVYLVTAGSVGLFALVLLVARRWTASATAYMFVLFPVVTMALGALLIDEPITLAGTIGALVVMAGVWFGISPDSRRSTVARPVDNTTAVLDPG
jgi:drug/metabolite transporter (DMT)-like permease